MAAFTPPPFTHSPPPKNRGSKKKLAIFHFSTKSHFWIFSETDILKTSKTITVTTYTFTKYITKPKPQNSQYYHYYSMYIYFYKTP